MDRNLPPGMAAALVAMAAMVPEGLVRVRNRQPKKRHVDQRRKARRKTAKASRRRNRK